MEKNLQLILVSIICFQILLVNAMHLNSAWSQIPPLSSCRFSLHTFPLNTWVKRSLWPLKPETSASALTIIHYLVTAPSPRGNTEVVCLLSAMCTADVCPFPRCFPPSTSGLGSKDRLTNQLSGESFSPVDWELPTVVSSLLLSGDNSVNRLWTADKRGRGWSQGRAHSNWGVGERAEGTERGAGGGCMRTGEGQERWKFRPISFHHSFNMWNKMK